MDRHDLRRRLPHEVRRPALSEDTEPVAERVQLDILRRMPAWRKAELVSSAILCSRALALAGLRRRYPEASPAEQQRRLMDLLLGSGLALRVYGPPPRVLEDRPGS